jgi:hypothetical protein
MTKEAIILSLILIVAISLSGFFFWQSMAEKDQQDLALQVKQKIVLVKNQIIHDFKEQPASVLGGSLCKDSDAKNYFSKGTTNYRGKNYTDCCYESNPKFLAEYYCQGGAMLTEWKYCEFGCQDGVCNTANSAGNNLSDFCVPEWQCKEWSDCKDNLRSRACSDVNNCGSLRTQLTETEPCF